MNTNSNKKVLFVLYPGSGETYLSYCIEKYFGITLNSIPKNDKTISESILNKTTSESGDFFDSKIYTIIYLIRDGRDAITSQIFNSINSSKQPVEAMDLLIEEAIIAQDGSYFNGWTNHINHWLHKANWVVKFEDFIANPSLLLEKVSSLLKLTNKSDKIEKFSEEKFGDHISTLFNSINKIIIPEKWNNHFSTNNQLLFYKLHYSNLIKFEYETDPTIPDQFCEALFDRLNIRNIYKNVIPKDTTEPINILFDATKIQMPHNDGIKRYVLELLKSYQEIIPLNNSIKIDVYDGVKLYNISEIDLDSYWYIIPIKDPILKLIKTAIVNQLKNLLKQSLSKSAFINLSLTYKQFKYNLKDIIITKLQNNQYKQENNSYILSNSVYEKYNLVHVPLLQDVDFINHFKSKAFITIHDLTHITHPEFHTVDNIRIADSGLKAAMKYKSNFISISKYTQKDIINQGIKDVKVPFVHEAADVNKFYPYQNKYWSVKIRNKYNIPENCRFFLSLSTLEPRKNLKNSILAFQKCIDDLPDDFYFVIAGKKGWNIDEVIPDNIENNNKIIFTGFIDEDDLAWIYRESYALVYTSHYEGFGLPILEAMSCGKPVIYGYNSSMIEIGQNAGIGVDSHNLNSISNAMNIMANNTEFYKSKSELAFSNSNKYNWFKTGLLTLNQYIERVKEKEVELCLSTGTY
jgi:glycosyltransferase involved in cell wall biosynthesis